MVNLKAHAFISIVPRSPTQTSTLDDLKLIGWKAKGGKHTVHFTTIQPNDPFFSAQVASPMVASSACKPPRTTTYGSVLFLRRRQQAYFKTLLWSVKARPSASPSRDWALSDALSLARRTECRSRSSNRAQPSSSIGPASPARSPLLCHFA